MKVPLVTCLVLLATFKTVKNTGKHKIIYNNFWSETDKNIFLSHPFTKFKVQLTQHKRVSPIF